MFHFHARALLAAACALGLLGTAAYRRSTTAASADCLDPAKVNPQAICTMNYHPVCGCDGKTYANTCVAERSGVRT